MYREKKIADFLDSRNSQIPKLHPKKTRDTRSTRYRLAQSWKLKSADWSRRRQRKSTDTVALEQVGNKLGKGPPRETTKKQRRKVD